MLSLTLVLLLPVAQAELNHGWEWELVGGHEKTEITYAYDASANSTWQEWVEEAVKEWSDAATGWTFKKVADPATAQVVIKVANTGNATRDPWAATDWTKDPITGRTTKRTITFDEDPSKWDDGTPSGDNKWGVAGADTMDPRSVAKHELGHTLRLKDVKDPTQQDAIMWYGGSHLIGRHPYQLAQNDTDEAKDSVKPENRGIATVKSIITPLEGGELYYYDPTVVPTEIKANIHVPPGAVTEPTTLTMTVLYDAVPAPDQTPEGYSIIVAGIQIDATGPVPTTMSVSIYYGDLPIGPEFVPASLPRKLIDLPIIDENSMKAFQFITETSSWQEISMSYLYTSQNEILFSTSQLGFYGITGIPFQTSVDVNHDGTVDMADISMCIDAFMTVPGIPAWDPRCDINIDGSVDMADISLLVEAFMTTPSP